MNTLIANENFKYQRIYPKISGYTTVYNCEKMGIPYLESINSMLGFCDEVVVLDGCSDDGTYEKIEELAQTNEKIKVYQNPFDWTEPGVDGLQKAFARAMCEGDFLWQQDADEVVHENDYEKIKMICKRFPTQADILHLPVIELWGDEKHFTARRHAWKWRISRNKPEITHGINKYARVIDEVSGRVYAKKGMSDGCEYCNVMSNEPIGHVGFWNDKLELMRNNFPEQYEINMNKVFSSIPSVYHYSWFNIKNKISQLKSGGTWSKLWSLLYQLPEEKRFDNVDTKEQLDETVKKLYCQGGEDSDRVKYKCELGISNPKIMDSWILKNKGE